MRITQSMMQQTAIDDMQTNLLRLSKTQRRAVTGKRVSRPEDDPFAVEQSMGFRARIKAGDSVLRNIGLAQDWLNGTDKALNDMTDILQRAQSLAAKGASETLGADERVSVATEVDQVLEEAYAIANTKHGDQFLFAGFQINTQPFQRVPATGPMTSVTYNGDNGDMLREAEPGINISINTRGNPLLTEALEKLIELRDSLTASPFSTDNVMSIHSDLKSKMNEILDTEAIVGTKLRRLQTTADRVSEAQNGLESLLSDAEDADMIETISTLQQQQFAYQTALSVNAKVVDMSLLDFLR